MPQQPAANAGASFDTSGRGGLILPQRPNCSYGLLLRHSLALKGCADMDDRREEPQWVSHEATDGRPLSDEEYRRREKLFNCFTLGAILTSRPMLAAIRRELQRIDQRLSVNVSEIERMLIEDVLSPDVLQGPQANTANTIVNRSLATPRPVRNATRTRRETLQLTTSDPEPQGHDRSASQHPPL